MVKQISLSTMNFQSEGVWPLIARDRLLADLRRSLEHPETIHKQALPGADVVANLLQNHPQTYMRTIQSLWQNGSVCLRRQYIQAPTWVKSAQPPTDISVDVWMILVSLNGKIVLETAPRWKQWLRQYLYKAHLSLLLLDVSPDSP